MFQCVNQKYLAQIGLKSFVGCGGLKEDVDFVAEKKHSQFAPAPQDK